MNILDLKLKKNIFDFCIDDSADLLSIQCIINDYYKTKHSSKITILKIIQNLLQENLLKVGLPQKDGSFTYWNANSKRDKKKMGRVE